MPTHHILGHRGSVRWRRSYFTTTIVNTSTAKKLAPSAVASLARYLLHFSLGLFLLALLETGSVALADEDVGLELSLQDVEAYFSSNNMGVTLSEITSDKERLRWLGQAEESILIEAMGGKEDLTQVAVTAFFGNDLTMNMNSLIALGHVIAISLPYEKRQPIGRWFTQEFQSSFKITDGENYKSTFKTQDRVFRWFIANVHGRALMANLSVEKRVYKVVNEKVVMFSEEFLDTPIKSQVAQKFYVRDPITEVQLRELLRTLYNKAKYQTGSGFKHRTLPNSVFVWVYANKRQAQEPAFRPWHLGMMSKPAISSSSSISIDQSRVEAQFKPRVAKFGLSYEVRRKYFIEHFNASKRATDAADAVIPLNGFPAPETYLKNSDLRDEILAGYYDELLSKYGITEDQGNAIFLEGMETGFP